MNRSPSTAYTARPTITLELPLPKNTRIPSPQHVMLNVDGYHYDIGSLCYSGRSDKRRKHRKAREVALNTLIPQRPKQIKDIIRYLSQLLSDGGSSVATVRGRIAVLKIFLDWADSLGMYDCLSGGNPTFDVHQQWVDHNTELCRKGKISSLTHNQRLRNICEILESIDDQNDLRRSMRLIKRASIQNGTEPLGEAEFARVVALNHALFDGLCDLVLGQRPFPFKLQLPNTLGWAENHLWVFPSKQWRMTPQQASEKKNDWKPLNRAYDYTNGRVFSANYIEHLYCQTDKNYSEADRKYKAKAAVDMAMENIESANSDPRNTHRLMLASIAQNAFLFLFHSYTGANESVVIQIETDGQLNVSSLNQQYRSIKFRAHGKVTTVVIPTAFMPSLRRYMELRLYLLNSKKFPFLFFSQGPFKEKSTTKLRAHTLYGHYKNLLRVIDPTISRIGSRKLRSSVSDWFQRNYDQTITANFLQNSERTTAKHYDSGSPTDHRVDLSAFLSAVSESAKRQRIISPKMAVNIPLLEEGGCCKEFGRPQPTSENAPVKPNCSDGQGCLFCKHRVLIACEEDARRVASAAFVMEQAILGPAHETAFRPLIIKCDSDLEKIANFRNCRAMVDRVRKDVFQHGNLTPYFADKYQLLLELGATK